MLASARRSRPGPLRALGKDAVKLRRSMPMISSATADWLPVKIHSGSLRGEGDLPIQQVMPLNAETAAALGFTIPPSMHCAPTVIE